MKKLIALLCVLIVVGIAYFWPPQELMASTSNISKASPINSQESKIALEMEATTSATPIIETKSCSELGNVLNEIDFDDSLDKILDSISKEQVEGCKHEAFISRVSSIVEACFGPERLSHCNTELMFLRALMRAPFLEEPYNQAAIADLLMVEYSKASKERDQRKLADLTKRLLEKDPRNRKFQKLWAVVAYDSQVKLHKFPKKGLKKEIYETLDPAAWKKLELFRWHVESGNNQEKFQAIVRNSISHYPGYAASHEALGWSLWQQNKREEALEQLMVASSLWNKTSYYPDLIKKLNSPDAKLEDFPAYVNIGVEWKDLYN